MSYSQDSLNGILRDYQDILKENDILDTEIKSIHESVDRQISVCENTDAILEDAAVEFNKLTSIFNKKDLTFFIFSLVLQGGVKYAIKAMREMSDDELANKTPFHGDEKTSRSGERYYCTKEEIIANPVPFDATRRYGKDYYDDKEGGLPGFSGLNHRTRALGHDPILGLIFGTANIMTSTITRNDFMSWHVETYTHEGYKNPHDTISSKPASTIQIFSSIYSRLQSEGKEGWMTLGCALLKEIIHILSDIPSRQSLPFPIISVFSEKWAKQLSLYGLNLGTIAQGGFALMLINWLIGFLHGLCRDKNEDEALYEVRTRKIIMYFNALATVSDIGLSMYLAMHGDKNTMRKFDLGGYMVTLYQISHCTKVISEIETEFYIHKINQATLDAL
ncbi:MAG: hypothetical protein K2H92_04305 [Bacteroidaceae bacterium]|nr:hypothetical protein [Bacteroidaceae bacterium]